MGLFSKTKTYVESTTVSMYEDLPDTVKQSVLTSVVQDRSVSDDLINNTLNSLGVKVKSFYKYGRDNYYYGLPEGQTEYSHAGASSMQRVLEEIEGEPLVVQWLVYDKANSLYFAYEHLESNRGWDQDTNIVSLPPFPAVGDVLLQSTEWVNSTTIKLWYEDDISTHSEDITINTIDLTHEYYHVGYSVGGIAKYFYYDGYDSTYDILYVGPQEKESQYFPVVPFIRDNIDMSVEGSGDHFESSRRLLRKVGVNYEKVGRSIQDNPDIDGVDFTYLVITAPIQSDHTATKEYLFNYFFGLEQNQKYLKADYDAWLTTDMLSPPPMNIIDVSEVSNDAEGTGNYHVEVGFRYIESSTITGTIGDVGSVTRETTILPPDIQSSFLYENSYMTWRKQVTPTEYLELKVHGLKHVNYVYGKYTIDTSLEDSLSLRSDDFNLPVHYNTLKEMSILRRTDVMNNCIRLCFNSVQRVKLDWYQTSAFKIFVVIAAAVITVYTAGTSGWAMNWASTITGVSGATALNYTLAVVLVAASSIVVGELFKMIGVEKVAVLQALYYAYQLYNGNIEFLSGESLLHLQSGITAGFNFYIKNESHNLMREYDEMLTEQEEEQAKLDELMEAFPSSYLDPMTLIDNTLNLASQGESPAMYYNTRIHSGNIGALVFNDIEYFVDKNLQLEGITDRNALDI